MRITIIKTLSNTVLIKDKATGFIYKELKENSTLLFSSKEDRGEVLEGGVFIIDEDSNTYNIRLSEVVDTQVLPAAAIPFTGAVKDLYQLLETTFFFNIVNPPTSTGVNIFNSNGALTADRELVGTNSPTNFSLGLIDLNKFLLNYEVKEEVIGDQTILTLAYNFTLSGNANIDVINIPLNTDFDVVEVFGRCIYREAGATGVGREDFFGACTRNAGGALQLDNNNVQGFRRESLAGNASRIRHRVLGSNYVIRIDPNSGAVNRKYYIWLEIHKANIII